MERYPTLAEVGCLPEDMSEISNDKPPWFCHGLALRMATFSDEGESLLDRWENLLNLARQANGWPEEFKRWSGNWAKEWDRFHQFLWLLQCYEYFTQRGLGVSFPPANKNEAKPDLLVRREGHKDVYVECYFYSKWWAREQFLEYLLRKIDPDLSITRKHNIARNAGSNPFHDRNFTSTLDRVSTELTKSNLARLRVLTEQAWPQVVCKFDDIIIELRGNGEYQPRVNAHGDPVDSWPKFVKEISQNKEASNNLSCSRPNVLMVNALGLDFQFGLKTNRPVGELSSSIDEAWISACGVDEKVAAKFENHQVHKWLRTGCSGSGL